MSRAAIIRRFGGPDVFELVEEDVAGPGATDVRINQTAIGINFADTYMRSGNHPTPLQFPAALGVEAAGAIQDLGDRVQGFSRGDRVVYFGLLGAYAETRVVPADHLIKLPAEIDDLTAAALMTKGVTAQYLCRQVFAVQAGQTVLVHAAAGGVGSMLSQWCAALGATVIGTVGSEHKVAIAKGQGCHHVIVTSRQDFVARVKAITSGEKVNVVFDSLGKETSAGSLDCLRPRGTLVIYGRTTGYPPTLAPSDLMEKGSLVVTMTQLKNFAGDHRMGAAAATSVFDAVRDGILKVKIGQRYSLDELAQAHRDLEARKTVGCSVLVA